MMILNKHITVLETVLNILNYYFMGFVQTFRIRLGLPLVLIQFILYLLNSFIKFSNSVSISSLVIPFCNAPFFTLF